MVHVIFKQHILKITILYGTTECLSAKFSENMDEYIRNV